MSTQESFQLLRDLRIDVSEDVMLEMIKISEGNIQKAINNYFEFGPPKKLPKKPSNTVATRLESSQVIDDYYLLYCVIVYQRFPSRIKNNY